MQNGRNCRKVTDKKAGAFIRVFLTFAAQTLNCNNIKSQASAFHILGIRHHGPGSSRSMLRALEAIGPDCILIEGPPDAEPLIPFVAQAGMVPPVAMLIYNPKNLEQAAFYPFAEFSPEWQAMLYGLQRQIPVRFMDLPQSVALALKAEAAEKKQLLLDLPDEEASPEALLLRLDPFTRIARLGGYTDSERWWEAVVERTESDPAGIFNGILDLMRAMRDDKALAGQSESRETLLREAQMRQIIRAAQKDGFQNIAIVCGAWHGPALEIIDSIKSSADAALLKGLKKIKTEATWIPWSFDRLSIASGYGAGVISPAWYRVLFAKNEHATAEWLTQAARLLREHDFSTSSAHVIEAIRLADTLAILRHTLRPGITELREAAITVLTEGEAKPLELIDREMVIGNVLGAVPDTVSAVPLKADFEDHVRKMRLEKNTMGVLLALDLRKEAHLEKSKFLHRLVVLGLKWAVEQPVKGQKQGRFHEDWQMKWLPDFEITIIEAGTWGNTVEMAATKISQKKIAETESLTDLTGLLGAVLKADLPGLLPNLLRKLQSVTALSKDVLQLADAVLPMVEVLRYGHARTMNLHAIEQLLAQIVPRVCLQFVPACVRINEEVAEDISKKILAVNRAISLLRQADYDTLWHRTLHDLATVPAVAPLLAGLSTRMLFDKALLSPELTGNAMRLHLSHAAEPLEGGQWLEGFLYGSGLLLIHHLTLWQILDTWIKDMDLDAFREMMPLLRRTFSKFPQPEREKMLELAKNKTAIVPSKISQLANDVEREEAVLPLLRILLG